MKLYGIRTKAKRVAAVTAAHVLHRTFAQSFVQKPTVLNLLANDICNSKCVMCDIWKKKRDTEITPTQLTDILADDLFSDLEYIGVSGGEPTLRKDIDAFFGALIDASPHLRATGIITNALRPEIVIPRIEACIARAHAAGLHFSVMVSLDGTGQVHDLVRGRPNNFASALQVARHFRERFQNDPLGTVSFGYTFTKKNIWNGKQTLDTARAEDIPIRFRVAEHINRLYNNDSKDIRGFTTEESYEIGLFFRHLEYAYESNPDIRRTYRSIAGMLLVGAKRTSGCTWRSEGATLDSRGQISYCAPRSPQIALLRDDESNTNGWTQYRQNIHQRRAIVHNACETCIHDYHWGPTLPQFITEKVSTTLDHAHSLEAALGAAAAVRPRPPRDTVERALVTGWYGTETAGDKAILDEVICRLRRRHPQARLSLASLDPQYTMCSLRELDISDVQVVDMQSPNYRRAVAAADEIVLGGGPLMDIDPLRYLLWAAVWGRQGGARVHIDGCGLGPFEPGSQAEKAIAALLRLATTTCLRDHASVALAKRLVPLAAPTPGDDPAVAYVRRWAAANPPPPSKQRTLHLYLREWTKEYAAHLSDAAFHEARRALEHGLASKIRGLCTTHNLTPVFFPMHHYVVGNDDRDFARRLSRDALADLKPIVERRPLSIQGILASMQASTLNLCMRFHSVVFADTLRTDYLAIDYTGGGKIHAFLSERNKTARMLTIQELSQSSQ